MEELDKLTTVLEEMAKRATELPDVRKLLDDYYHSGLIWSNTFENCWECTNCYSKCERSENPHKDIQHDSFCNYYKLKKLLIKD